MLLGAELFDKSAPGVTLTAKGEVDRQLRAPPARAQRPDARRDDARRPGGAAAHRACGRLLRRPDPARARRASAARIRICGCRSPPNLPRHCCATCAAATTTSWSRLPTPSSPKTRTGAGSSRPPGARHRRRSCEGDGPVPLLVVGESSLSRRLSVSALERAGPGLPDRLCGAGASPAWSRPRAAGLGVACWARRCLLEAGLQVLDGVPRLPAVADVYGGVYLREGLDLPEVERARRHDRGGGRRGDRCRRTAISRARSRLLICVERRSCQVGCRFGIMP